MNQESQPLISPAEDCSEHEVERKWRRELLGMGFMALSPVGSTLQALLVRVGHAHWTTFEMLFSRGFVQMLVAIAAFQVMAPTELKRNGGLLGPKDQRRLLMQRGLAGCAGSLFYYSSLGLLPLGEATVVFFTSPIFTVLLASLWLGESLGLFEISAALVSLLGVFLISQAPENATESMIRMGIGSRVAGISAGLTGAICAALAHTTIRRMGDRVHFLVNVFYFAIVTSVVGGLAALLETTKQNRRAANLTDVSLLLGIGVAGFLAQSLLTLGFQLSKAGRGALVRYLAVPFAFGLGVVLLGEIPTAKSVLGSALVISSVLALALRVWIQK